MCKIGGDKSHPSSPFISTVSCSWRISLRVKPLLHAVLRTSLLVGDEILLSPLSVHRYHRRYSFSCLLFLAGVHSSRSHSFCNMQRTSVLLGPKVLCFSQMSKKDDFFLCFPVSTQWACVYVVLWGLCSIIAKYCKTFADLYEHTSFSINPY